MSTAKTVREINDALAMQVNAEARSQPHSPYANKHEQDGNGKRPASEASVRA